MALMLQEAKQTAATVARQLAKNQSIWQAIAKRLKQCSVPFAFTVARGSSDHAAMFAKYLFETQLGLPVVSAAPSIITLYHQQLKLKDALVLGLSQSGRSEDLVAVMQQARQAGAITVAIVNDEDSPLAQAAEFVVPILAGPEQAVAATKSYLGTLFALLHGMAILQQDKPLLKALDHAEQQLELAAHCDWTPWCQSFAKIEQSLIIGRGFGFAIALETALKLKETCVIHAEAFSSAEVQHGPFALIREHLPILVYGQHDATLPGTVAIAKRMAKLGAEVWFACPPANGGQAPQGCQALHLPESIHPLLDPLLIMQAFYVNVLPLAVLRGRDPDAHDNLQKVTITL